MLALRIHCWGGLGSQLLAVALLVDLEKRFPSRRFILVLHQGGVTLRESEIDSLFVGIKTKQVIDFKKIDDGSSESRKIESGWTAKRIIKKLFNSMAIVLPLSGDDDFRRVQKYTLSIRGHYSYRFISRKTVKGILEKLNRPAMKLFRENSGCSKGVGVHYRLGDLLTLETKKPLDETRVVSVVRDALQNNDLKSLTVFSDSPKVAKTRFEKHLVDISISSPDVSTWEAITELVHFKYFVGTFSKVSLWIVIFRYYSEEVRVSFMPLESRNNIEDFLGLNLDSDRIKFY